MLIMTFGMMCLALLAQKLWICCRDTQWRRSPPYQCSMGNTIGIFSLTSELPLSNRSHQRPQTQSVQLMFWPTYV